MLHKLFILSLLLVIQAGYSQSVEETRTQRLLQQIAVQHDNDFVFAIDRYYTAGTFLSYSRQLQGDFIFKKLEYPLQLDIMLGQETYTPRELFETNFDFFERPYAGYLFVRGSVSKAQEDVLFKIDAELGLAGEQSKAGDIQVAYHELINEFIPVWEGEIGNSVHFNGFGTFVKDYRLENSNLFKNVALQSTVALGTRRVFARQEALLYIGNRDVVASSSAFGRLGGKHEFYGFAGVGAEYVFLNALIEGHPFGDDSPFTLPIVSTVLSFKSGITYRGENNLYSVVYNFRTRETKREGRSQYVALQFARKF
ncbi:lipid A deacylase LpxR family protein [uncultured Dokdonia sp.]|uniref:lipid A deacylase LpxR family protein n=1 Tax=uncultured Dokdonia sp. TaxID=575653 RepID=UPI0030EBE6BA